MDAPFNGGRKGDGRHLRGKEDWVVETRTGEVVYIWMQVSATILDNPLGTTP